MFLFIWPCYQEPDDQFMKITPLSHHPHRHVCQHHQDPRHRHLDCHQVVWYVLVKVPSSRTTLASLPLLFDPQLSESSTLGSRWNPDNPKTRLCLIWQRFLDTQDVSKEDAELTGTGNGNIDKTPEGAAFFCL